MQRRNRSLFSANVVSHADQLRLAAKPIGAELTVRSVCAFTANSKAGVAVAVVLDGDKQHDVRAMSRIAERCIDSCVVVAQPYGSGSRANSRGSSRQGRRPEVGADTPGTPGSAHTVPKLFLLTPGGPSSRTQAAAMALAGLSMLLEHPQIQFAQLFEDELYGVKVCSPVGAAWEETLNVKIGDDGAIWVKVPSPQVEAYVEP